MEKSLKVLMVSSSDPGVLKPGSGVYLRMVDFGNLVGELHIILFAKSSLGLKETQISQNVWVYPTNSINRWFYVFDAIRLGIRLVKDKVFVRGASLVTTQDPFEAGLSGLIISRKWRLPLEVQMHIDPLFTDGYDGWLDRIRYVIGLVVIPRSSSIRVVANFIAERLKQKFKNLKSRIYTLPVLIDGSKIVNAPVTFDVHARYNWGFVVLMVARLVPQKNLFRALEAMRKVVDKYPNTGLIILGAGREELKLRRKINQLDISANVSLAGWQSELGSFYKTSNAFLQTSLFEGYGMALVEAGLSGLPIVTTKVGLATEIDAGHEALICRFDDVNCFADSLIKLIENNELREYLKSNMNHFVNEHLLSKADYLKTFKGNWEAVASATKY